MLYVSIHLYLQISQIFTLFTEMLNFKHFFASCKQSKIISTFCKSCCDCSPNSTTTTWNNAYLAHSVCLYSFLPNYLDWIQTIRFTLFEPKRKRDKRVWHRLCILFHFFQQTLQLRINDKFLKSLVSGFHPSMVLVWYTFRFSSIKLFSFIIYIAFPLRVYHSLVLGHALHEPG